MSDPSLHSQLQSAVKGLNDSELRPVLHLAQRIRDGRKAYGEVFPQTDERDFLCELRDELTDGLAYIAWRLEQ